MHGGTASATVMAHWACAGDVKSNMHERGGRFIENFTVALSSFPAHLSFINLVQRALFLSNHPTFYRELQTRAKYSACMLQCTSSIDLKQYDHLTTVFSLLLSFS
ncbi:hypothetical protein SISNIDRAFT_352232 [Sistotremastrum niveocremeum HHB9708]|uniref:Uncharacterized protein n=1 Tax=Sistotremastrum niveocremeum HHB9708 TaxID=1314777 RepID=A0A164X2L8_9AGAM|nr:hypothetical protein SISNIDRAFT_352232 [Sistotremastrum niveocremeum HHB9708]